MLPKAREQLASNGEEPQPGPNHSSRSENLRAADQPPAQQAGFPRNGQQAAAYSGMRVIPAEQERHKGAVEGGLFDGGAIKRAKKDTGGIGVLPGQLAIMLTATPAST